MAQEPWYVWCSCKGSSIEFRSMEPFTQDALKALFCPVCVTEAPEGTLLVQMSPKNQGASSAWGILFSVDVLKEQDPQFSEGKEYLIRLFQDGKIIFNFIPQKAEKQPFQVLGIKDSRSVDQFLSTKETR